MLPCCNLFLIAENTVVGTAFVRDEDGDNGMLFHFLSPPLHEALAWFLPEADGRSNARKSKIFDFVISTVRILPHFLISPEYTARFANCICSLVCFCVLTNSYYLRFFVNK